MKQFSFDKELTYSAVWAAICTAAILFVAAFARFHPWIFAGLCALFVSCLLSSVYAQLALWYEYKFYKKQDFFETIDGWIAWQRFFRFSTNFWGSLLIQAAFLYIYWHNQ